MTTAAETVVAQLPPEVQRRLLEQVRAVKASAPLFRPQTPSGAMMRVLVTAAGELGWLGDEGGYRYSDLAPNGFPWPQMPDEWRAIASTYAPEVDVMEWDSAIVNYYAPDAALGWHRDVSERDTFWPIVTISLGDSAQWAVRAHEERSRPSRVQIDSGAVTLLAGPTRDYEHSIERVIAAPMFRTLCGMERPGRISITIRVAG